jgi:DNA mismatch repair protein MutS
MPKNTASPLTRQYDALKRQVPDALLLVRLGDFHALFFEDATLAGRELGITLDKEKGAHIPILTIARDYTDRSIARLVHKGHRVAICDQRKNPEKPGRARNHARGSEGKH